MISHLFEQPSVKQNHPVRTITQLNISRQGNLLVFDLRANAFLQHIVRNIIGCLVYIGKGKYSPEWMSELLESCDRAEPRSTNFLACRFIYLAGVVYDSVWPMPRLTDLPIIPGLLTTH